MKKIISILVLVAMVAVMATAAAAAGETTVTVSDVTAKCGDEVQVTVDITNNPGFTVCKLTVSYDAEALELVKVGTEILTAGVSNSCLTGEGNLGGNDGNLEAGTVAANHFNVTPVTEDGAMLVLTFKVLADNANTAVSVEVNKLTNNGVAVELASNTAEGTVTAACQHAHTEVRDAKEATCTVDGYTGDTWCTDCGEKIAEGEVISATGHNYGEWVTVKEATCTEDGLKERKCACGETETEVIPATGHNYGEWVIVKEATCTEDGLKERKCACGETETEVIPATGHNYENGSCTNCGEKDPNYDDVPPTGDAILTVVAALSVAAAAAFVCKRKLVA